MGSSAVKNTYELELVEEQITQDSSFSSESDHSSAD